ncbi:MAG: hypothetical protein KY455_05880 [Euryarchaeota archaeon]|nr:hypothetical protein [Euryarchaeota archaeon]
MASEERDKKDEGRRLDPGLWDLEGRPETDEARVPKVGTTYHTLLEFCHTHIGKLDVADREFRHEYEIEHRGPHADRRPDLPEDFATFLDDRSRFGIKVGLDNMRALLKALHLDRMRVPVILVGGTNGKGTVATAIGDALGRARYRPGVYLSPHVERFLERIQVSGGDPDLHALHEACDTVRGAVARLEGAGVHPTYFEVATALALEVFRRHEAMPLVMEVGLGGRGDATNALEPMACVITNVGSDHAEHLGRTLAERVREKAGIMRPGVPCFTAAQGEALRLLKRHALDVGADLVPTVPEHPAVGADEAALAIVRSFVGHGPLRRVLRGLDRVDPASVRLPRLPGRRERYVTSEGTLVLLDVAHNHEAWASLAELLRTEPIPRERRVLLCGIVREKDPRALAVTMAGQVGPVHVTRPEGERALPAEDLASALRAEGVAVARVEEDPVRGLAEALLAAGPDGMVVAVGSFYLASALRPLLREVARYVF